MHRHGMGWLQEGSANQPIDRLQVMCTRKGVGEVRTQSLRSHALECGLMSSKWDLSLVQSVLSNCILSKYRAFATQPSPLIIITVHL